MTDILFELQRALEELYRVDAEADVRDFVISDKSRESHGAGRASREQLLLREDERGLEVGLFVDELALGRLDRGLDPRGANLGEFLLAAEGVSHFLYVSVRAREERRFSGLELELQAEVDKYLLTLLAAWPHADGLRERLFARVSFLGDLSTEEHDRYHAANAAADGYVASLEARFVRPRRVEDLLAELRRFYRLDCAGKLDHIVKRAA